MVGAPRGPRLEARIGSRSGGLPEAGRRAHLADGVRHALGRAPRDVADHARRAAATRIWNERHHA